MELEYQFLIVFMLGFFVGRTLKLFIMSFAVKVFFKMMEVKDKEKIKKSFAEKINDLRDEK